MPTKMLTGTKIRERRIASGIRQSALAGSVGISATYLNLIEHNKRRIGGKLLSEIASKLQVSQTSLTDGIEEALLGKLQLAASRASTPRDELEPAEEFAGRYPGWASLVADQVERITDLEQMVESLSDRLSHDPALSDALHDLLSTVTAIGSAAAILVETDQIEDEWRDRFHRNIHEDSQRLATSSQSLVTFLETTDEKVDPAIEPRDIVDNWFAARGHHIPELEHNNSCDNAALFEIEPSIKGSAAQSLAAPLFANYRADADAMPLPEFATVAEAANYDPARIAVHYSIDLASVFRRLAALPSEYCKDPFGLVVCDASGALTYRKEIDGFSLPRFGSGCPLWPLYQALSKPAVPIRRVVETTGRDIQQFLAYAVAQPVGSLGFDKEPRYVATMLIVRFQKHSAAAHDVEQVGMSCRVCARSKCSARREASILQGF